MTYLLDTNVVSEARRPRGDPGVQAWLASIPRQSVYLSVLVLGEIRRGIESLRPRDPSRAAAYETWLAELHCDYGDRVVAITAEVAEEWGRLSVPRTLPTADALMAATARVHRLTLVTRNTRDFARTGVPLLNPFELSS
jgi:predicted nucleic acid-binding protein